MNVVLTNIWRCVILSSFIAISAFGQDIQDANALMRFHSYGSAASLNGITSPAPQAGSIAYRSDLGKIMFYNGSSWTELGGSTTTSSGWGLSGNALNSDINKFIGTTDNSVFLLKSNNLDRLLIMPSPSNRHRVLFSEVVFQPNNNLNNSAVLGINGNQGRLRITSGDDDTFDNTQGACIDLHGNNAEAAFAGRLDLVAGSSSLFSPEPDIVFWIVNGPWLVFPMVSVSQPNNISINHPFISNYELSVNGDATCTGGGLWTVFSDRRIKKNVTPYKKGLEHILKINPVSYQYTEKSNLTDLDRTYVGVIAQEIEEVLPATVTTTNDSLATGIEDLKSFNSSEILFTLINAVKELHEESIALENENIADRKTIEKLKKSIKNKH